LLEGLCGLFEGKEVPVAKILGTRYSRILTYPVSDEAKVRFRIRELSAAGVSSLVFTGSTVLDGVRVLGKGCVGIVTLAKLDGAPVALKIKRNDADRPSMTNEARLLRLANSVDVGPRLITATKDFIAMEFFQGMPLFRWAEQHTASNMRAVKELLGNLLHSCYRLDAIGLDHGELSHAPKNVLVSRRGEGCIVDFESASTVRRVANVTSLLQYFLYGRISKAMRVSKIFPRKAPILRTLTEYKQEPSVGDFQNILVALGLA
jgi:putative serine/threonine protein kinase